MKTYIRFDNATQTGALVVEIPFERGLPKEAYEGRLNYILALGGATGEARAFAGHLDELKPSDAIAKMKNLAPSLSCDWQKLLQDAAKEAR